MAGQGAKKRLEENKKRLTTLRTLLVVGLLCQLAILGLAIRKGTWGFGHIAGLVVTTAVGFACFTVISGIAKPVLDEQGEMIDGGGDLNRGGINGYSHDILYITSFVQVATLLSSWFWYAYLAIPGYALYQLTIHVIIPHFKSSLSNKPAEMEMDAGTRKKMQKTEDRAQRRRNKWS